jgi:hypothetical protein
MKSRSPQPSVCGKRRRTKKQPRISRMGTDAEGIRVIRGRLVALAVAGFGTRHAASLRQLRGCRTNASPGSDDDWSTIRG